MGKTRELGENGRALGDYRYNRNWLRLKIVLYFYFDTWSVLIGLFDFLSEFYSGPHNFHHSQYHGFRDNLHQVIISPSQM